MCVSLTYLAESVRAFLTDIVIIHQAHLRVLNIIVAIKSTSTIMSKLNVFTTGNDNRRLNTDFMTHVCVCTRVGFNRGQYSIVTTADCRRGIVYTRRTQVGGGTNRRVASRVVRVRVHVECVSAPGGPSSPR